MSNVPVLPTPIINNVAVDLSLSQTNNCGANVFNYNSKEAIFVVNGKENCQLGVRYKKHLPLVLSFQTTLTLFLRDESLLMRNLKNCLHIEDSQIIITNIDDLTQYIQAKILIVSKFGTVENSYENQNKYMRHLNLLVDDPMFNWCLKKDISLTNI